MKKLYMLIMMLAVVTAASARYNVALPSLAGAEKAVPSANAQRLAESGAFKNLPGSRSSEAPAPLGDNFSDWEILGTGHFFAECGVMEPCDVTVWYCTTDPYGYGVDSWYIDGIFPKGLRVAGMPFIDYYNIGQLETGKTLTDGTEVLIDELSNHYSVGMETLVDMTLGRINIASLYYVGDPDDPSNVVAYGMETIQLDGDFKDYRVDFSVAGETREGNRLKTNINFVDATNVKVKAYQGALTYPQIITSAMSQHTDESIANVEASGAQYFDLTDNGTYTVIATFDKGEDDWEYLTATYDYDSRWEYYGKAAFTEDYFASYYDEFPILTAEGIAVERHTESDGIYRLVNPYTTTDTWTSLWSKLAPYDEEINSFLVINAERPEMVYIYINPVDITYDDGIRMVCGSAAHYNMINDRTDEQITAKGYWGTIVTDGDQKTIDFPQMSLMMRPANSEYPLFANNNDGFKVVMTADKSGIAAVDADAEAAPVYYNLQGVRVAEPVSGAVTIVVRGGKVTKEIVR